MSDPLLDALDRLVPTTRGEKGDWDAVLDAAGVSQPASFGTPAIQRRPTRRQLTIVAVAIAAVTVVSVTPAFGLRDLLLDLVHGRTPVSFVKSRPAPPEIKQRFLDLALGAPRGMNPQVLPNQARQITFLTPLGERRVIWVAPTRGGGFCSVGGMSGGCISRQTERRVGAVDVNGELTARHGSVTMIEVSGHVFSPLVSSLTLDYQDGQSMQLPFVFISAPINAGFYALGLPPTHQQKGHWPTRVIALDAHGHTIGTATIRIPPRLFVIVPQARFKPAPPRALPAAITVNPTAPTQTATREGVTLMAGANGAVRLTTHNLSASLRPLLHHNVSISCFRITREFGIFTVRSDGVDGALARSIGFTISGVGRPLDGCEVDDPYGHRWPDKLGSHSPVELAFTAKGRAYFADRAAARDLALFVRSARMQRIRKEPNPKLVHDMKTTYGPALAHSRIRYMLTPHGITFTETSTTGKVFRVVIVNGHITHNNIAPYSKVF